MSRKPKLTNLPNADARIIETKMSSLHIEPYDLDNGYPQRIHNLVNASSTAKSAVALYAKFMRGGGFVNPVFYKAIVDGAKLTADKLLRRSTADAAEFRGCVFHVTYNQLFQKTAIAYVPFENARKSKSSEEKYMNKIALCSHWYNSNTTVRQNVTLEDIDFIDVYDPNPEVIIEQVTKAGGWENYKGQVLYVSFDFESYPLASCDAIIDEMRAEIASSRTTYNNLKNNFGNKVVFTIGEEFETEEERDDYLRTLQAFVGPEGEQLMLAEGSLDEKGQVSAPDITEIPNNLNDKIFEYSDNKVTRKIIRSYNQPGILHTDTDTSALGKDDILNASDFYNAVTADERQMFVEIFTDLFTDFVDDVNPQKNFDIIPFSYFPATQPAQADAATTDQ